MAIPILGDELGMRDQVSISPLEALINGRLGCENALKYAEENLQRANKHQQEALASYTTACASLAEYNQWLHKQGLHSHTTGGK